MFFEPSFKRWNSFDHFFEHSNECTSPQEPFFEWIYSCERSFGHFSEGSWSTRTYLSSQCELHLTIWILPQHVDVLYHLLQELEMTSASLEPPLRRNICGPVLPVPASDPQDHHSFPH